ncbi:MAG: hypothetical protein JOZ39_01765, partial [Chloroflexi bacterium]|nr:hypothetical protein [Chloroflexota bacterium]
PLWLAATTASADLLAVAGVYLVGRRCYGLRTGLFAAALFAANAYATIFARKAAGTFFEPAAATVLLAFLLAAPRRPWAWLGVAVTFGVLLQLHLATILLAPALAALFIALNFEALAKSPVRRAPMWVAALIGVLAVGALFAPYAAHELSHNPNWSTVGAGALHLDASGPWLVWVLMTSPAYGDLAGAATGLFNSESWLAGWVTPLAGIAILGGFVLATVRWREWRFLTLVIFSAIPMLMIVRHSVDLRIHYFAFLEPALFLLGGLGLDWLVGRRRWLIAPTLAMAGVLLATQIFSFDHFLDFVQRQPTPGGYGLPLTYRQRITAAAQSLASGRVIETSVEGRDDAETSQYLLEGQPGQNTDATAGLRLPAAGAVYVSLSAASTAGQVLANHFAPLASVPLPGGDTAAAYRIGPQDYRALNLRPPATGAPWANGVSLLGSEAPSALPGRLVSAWLVGAPVDPTTVFFNQLLDKGGRQWLDRDATPIEAGEWRPGDVIVSVSDGVLPAGAPRQAYSWFAGMYDHGGRRVAAPDGSLQAELGHVRGGMPAATPAGLRAVNATFGGILRLDGYSVTADRLILAWTCVAEPARDYTVFVHVVDGEGHVVAQDDAQPLDGGYPTAMWATGEKVIDPIAIAVAPGARLEIGLYDAASGQRLTLDDGRDAISLIAGA